MPPRKNSVKRRLRSLGGKVIRRLQLLPGGIPDGLGDEAHLIGTVLHGESIVFFPDTSDSLYQIRSWYGPLVALHKVRGVTIVCMDSRLARRIRSEVEIPVLTIADGATLDELVARSETKLMLYVNYNPLNFLALRIRSVLHVSLMHGDSDKGVSVSNQAKAFDFSFVAGQAAIDRYARYVSLFDAESRCIAVGWPRLDTDPAPAASTAQKIDRQHTVLYAPTWEGGQASVAYGSLPMHGVRLVESLIDAGLRVIYRPHPLTGVRDGRYGNADARLRDLLAERSGGHLVSEGRSLQEDFLEASLLICDVSAVAIEWLVTGKPLIITRAEAGHAQEAETRLLQVAQRLAAVDADRAGELAMEQIRVDPERSDRAALTEYYLGDTSPGAALTRFLTACDRLCDLRDTEWARIRANESRKR